MLKRLGVFHFFILFFFAGAGGAQPHSPVFVRIAGQAHTLDELTQFVRKRPALQPLLLNRQGIDSVVQEYIDAQVFTLEGIRAQLPISPELKPGEDGYYFAVQFQLLPRCTPPDEATLQREYETNPETYATPPMLRVKRLVWPEHEPLQGRPAALVLEEIARALRDSPQSFATHEAQLRQAAALAGLRLPELGDLGFQTLLPRAKRKTPLEIQLGEAQIGQVIGPLNHDGFLFVLLVLDRREPVVTPWPQARAAVEREWVRTCRDQGLKALRKRLYQTYQVETDQDVVAQIQPLGSLPQRAQ